ncbi:MAG: peptidoglycan DD-metalloendopeptidase family protein [Sulfuricaulis sp.]
MKLSVKWCAATLLALVLAACGSFPLPPVSEQSTSMRRPPAGYREVMPGDTLYSISWESGRDYRDVARWNRITPPYLIKPGQKLRLFPPVGVKQPASPASPRVVTGTPPANKYSAAEKPSVVGRPRAPAGDAKRLVWIWPADGKLLQHYSANGLDKGIDIGGNRGQPILAAAAGQVVYQGGGLRGYGQLIIIKHNADYLSAYAHCDKTYVKEGSMVKRGQRIADMGSSGADRVMLHFEIRYRGAPVDPLQYLPRK